MTGEKIVGQFSRASGIARAGGALAGLGTLMAGLAEDARTNDASGRNTMKATLKAISWVALVRNERLDTKIDTFVDDLDESSQEFGRALRVDFDQACREEGLDPRQVLIEARQRINASIDRLLGIFGANE